MNKISEKDRYNEPKKRPFKVVDIYGVLDLGYVIVASNVLKILLHVAAVKRQEWVRFLQLRNDNLMADVKEIFAIVVLSGLLFSPFRGECTTTDGRYYQPSLFPDAKSLKTFVY